MFRPFSLFYLHFVIPYYALMNESLFEGCINIPRTLLEIKPVLAPTSKMPYLMYIVTQNSGPSGFFSDFPLSDVRPPASPWIFDFFTRPIRCIH